MPLTRHCYSQDEVQAALWYTGSRSVPKETVFWCQELLSSGWVAESISILFESWLWHRGPFQIHWYLYAWKYLSSQEVTQEDIIDCANRLSHCTIKDHSLWNILLRSGTSFSSLFDPVTPKSPSSFPSTDSKEIYFIRALYQHKAQSAWWISHYLSTERVWELMEWYRDYSITDSSENEQFTLFFDMIRQYDLLLGYRSDEYDNAIRCLVLLSLCLTPHYRKQSLSIPLKYNPISTPTELENLCFSRIYSIPMACLYGTTRRGLSSKQFQTMKELYSIEKGMKDCPFWDEELEKYQINHKWKSDESMEEFYEIHFPDDIPDEWTLQEKNKSHGIGLLRSDETVTLASYSQRYFTSISRFVWTKNSNSILHITNLISITLSDSPTLKLLTLLPNIISLDESILQPVHKRLVYRG